jgi:dTDP-4-amino-4,6-dideoxygalactose transaminase
MEWKVPLADVQLGVEEILAVEQVLRSGWLTMGEVTQAFEQEFAAFTGAKHALAVTNATAGLHMACLAVEVGPGDEVILPSLTFVASANAICYTGAQPVFADIESTDWLNISPAAIERAITPRTKAIMVVHYSGFACEMPAILDIAKQHGLAVIEDAAHAVGASLDGQALGTWGDVGVFSFFGNKNLTTGEGGMVVTNDDRLAAKLGILRSHGMTTLTWDRHRGHASTYDVVDLGYNYRIDEMRSALGREQLKKLLAGNARRAELVGLYRELLAELAPEVKVPFEAERGLSSYHIMAVLLPEGSDKLKLMEAMKAQRIQTSWHYPPVHTFTVFRDRRNWSDALRLTEAIAKREVTLPLYPGMRDEQVEMVVQALRESLAYAA